MRVESATSGDVPAMTALLAILFFQEAEFRPDADAQSRALGALLDDSAGALLLVARDDDGAVVGMVSLLFSVSTALGAPAAVLEDLVVDPAHRGRGVGGSLLDAALAAAIDRDCARVTLLTDADNTGGQALYAGRGFARSSMLVMRLALPLPDPNAR